MCMQILSEHQMRLDAAYHLEIPDHVPVFLHINSPWLVSYFGITYREYFNKPKVALRCQLLARKRFGDRTGVYPGNFPLEALVADAWGGPYRIYNDIPMQQTGPVIKSLKKLKNLRCLIQPKGNCSRRDMTA